jgi:hypothetical protein
MRRGDYRHDKYGLLLSEVLITSRRLSFTYCGVVEGARDEIHRGKRQN